MFVLYKMADSRYWAGPSAKNGSMNTSNEPNGTMNTSYEPKVIFPPKAFSAYSKKSWSPAFLKFAG